MAELFPGVLEGFLNHMKVRNYSVSSQRNYQQPLVRFLRFLELRGVSDIRGVGVEVMREYQLHLMEGQSPRGKPYTWANKCSHIRAVKRLFEYLERTGQILVNPSEFMKEPKKETRLPRNVMTEEQVQAVLAQPDLTSPKGVRDRAMMEVFYSTGLRLSEMLNLTLLDCDLMGGVVRVNDGKGAKDRVVPLGATAIHYLKAYIQNVRPKLVKPGNTIQALWLTRDGNVMGQQVVEITLRGYGKRAGVAKASPHVFRHSFATHMVKNGADIVLVSRILGHTRLEVTQKYAKVAGVEVKKTHGEAHPRERDDETPGEPTFDRVFRRPAQSKVEGP